MDRTKLPGMDHFHQAREWRKTSASRTIERPLAEEVPVGLAYNGCPHAVLMASPADVEDLAVGFTITERIAPLTAIRRITVAEHAEGLIADVTLAGSKAPGRDRTMEGRSGCGLCGVQKLADAVRPLPRLPVGLTVSHGEIDAALAALEEAQTLGKLTRAVHGAAWVEAGALRHIREDVGRHNALDKLIGAALRAGADPARAFIIVTSRCSYEMVEKTALAGVSLLVAISAPTGLALAKAEESAMTLVALARADGHTVFTHPERITDAP